MALIRQCVAVLWLLSGSLAQEQEPLQRTIIGGQGRWHYAYDPARLRAPPTGSLVNCHGFVLDSNGNIVLTYENDNETDAECLIQWKPDALGVGNFVSASNNLCEGTPHGLTIATDNDGIEYLYHANNDQKLIKTYLNGTIVWQVLGMFGQDSEQEYKPTWFAVPPTSSEIYLCDGYGSNNVYVFDRYTGTYLNQTFGGPGEEHGKFATNHGCVYDSRKIVVADREHGRLEYFDSDSFDYSHTVDLRATVLGNASRPCILRRSSRPDGMAVVADLTGSVAILNALNKVVSVVNTASLIGHLHPHDAQMLPNGDLIVATWNPGQLSYWKLLPFDEDDFAVAS